MKPLLCTLLFCCLSVAAFAQPAFTGLPVNRVDVRNALHKTKITSRPTDRWYSYDQYLDTLTSYDRAHGGPDNYIATYAQPLWNDTNGMIATSGSLVHNTMISTGSILSPAFEFNNCDLYFDEMAVRPYDAYIVDSVQIIGYYGCNPLKSLVVDTLRISFLYGQPDTKSKSDIFYDYSVATTHYGRINFLDVAYDTILNMGTANINVPQYQDILLHNTDSGFYAKIIPLMKPDGITPSPINAGAGSSFALTMTFKSGDTACINGALSAPTPGDTLISDVPPYYKYNIFQPVIDFFTLTPPGGATLPAPDYPYYNSNGLNEGLFKKLPTSVYVDSIYIPTWVYQRSTPTYLQFPIVNWHLNCLSCHPVFIYCPDGILQHEISADEITISPNPANEYLTITYSLIAGADVSATLINIMGQVVITANRRNTTEGNIVLNTTNLPSGMYIYKVKANGEVATGKVMIEH